MWLSRKQTVFLLKEIFPLSLVFIPLLFEGMGYGNEQMQFVYLIIPCFMYLYFFFFKERISVPKIASTLFLLLAGIFFISTFFFSVDRETSLLWFFYYVSLTLLFLFFYNVPVKEETFFKMIFFLSAVFVSFSLMIGDGDNVRIGLFFNLIQYVIPRIEYQFLYAYAPLHNYLGDFLGLFTIACFYFYLRKKKILYLCGFLLSIPLIFESYSRSAYVGVVAVVGIMTLRKTNFRWRGLLIALFIIFIFAGYFILTTPNFQTPALNTVRSFIMPKLGLESKYLDTRSGSLHQSFVAIRDRPLFGWGLGNNSVVSLKYVSDFISISDSAFNIFLETAVGSGIMASFILLALIIILILKSYRRDALYFYAFLYLLINFQTNASYHLFSFFALMAVCAALMYKEDNGKISTSSFALIALIPVTIAICALTSMLLISNNPRLALLFNPYSKDAYTNMLSDNSIINNPSAFEYARKFEQASGGNLSSVLFLADFYDGRGDEANALRLYKQAYFLQPLLAPQYAKRMYELLTLRESSKKAVDFFRQIIIHYQKIPRSLYVGDFKKNIDDFCIEAQGKICP